MKIYTIGAPMKYGCNVAGADLGITKLSERINFDKILNVETILEENNFKMKNIKTITNYNNVLACLVREKTKDNVVITIGGDHSIAVGTIAGSSDSKMGVLWIDSHGDINNEEVTLTGNVHGFPLASSIGLGPKCLNECFENRQKVDRENIVIFGCSDLDDSEIKIINDNNLNVYILDDIKNDFDNKLIEAINYLKNNVDQIHLSLDIDSINPNIMKAVNVKTRANDGFSLNQIYKLIDTVFNNIRVKSVDIVEFNPLNDEEEFCFNEVVNIYNYIVDKIKKI